MMRRSMSPVDRRPSPPQQAAVVAAATAALMVSVQSAGIGQGEADVPTTGDCLDQHVMADAANAAAASTMVVDTSDDIKREEGHCPGASEASPDDTQPGLRGRTEPEWTRSANRPQHAIAAAAATTAATTGAIASGDDDDARLPVSRREYSSFPASGHEVRLRTGTKVEERPVEQDVGAERDGDTSGDDGDPYNIERFVKAHRDMAARAIAEIQAGRKRSHWSWFMFVTPPYRRNGRIAGSAYSRYYAVGSDEEADAFLDNAMLRANYLALMEGVAEACEAGTTLSFLVGIADVPKVRASVAYFVDVAARRKDVELKTALDRVAAAIGEEEKQKAKWRR